MISIPIRNIPKGYIAFGLPNISQHSPHHMEAVLYRKFLRNLYRLGVSRDAAYSRSEYHSALGQNITFAWQKYNLQQRSRYCTIFPLSTRIKLSAW